MHAFAATHMLFGCAIWGHAFGAKLQLRAPAVHACRQLSTMFNGALRWAIRAPRSLRISALLLLCNTVPLHGLIVK